MASTEEALDVKALPKIELHAHLSGSISRQCLHEVWLRKKAAGETDLEDPLVVMPPGKHDYDLKTFFPLFSSYIYNLVNDEWALTYTTTRVLQDFADDGVVYLELRTTPRALGPLSKADYVRRILDAIAAFEESSSSSPSGARLRTRLILSVDRRNTPAQALEVVDLCRAFPRAQVVGIDLCGDPARGGIEALSPAFEAARAVDGLGMTLHFAEAECSGSEAELDLLLGWRPDRIGHVIHVGERARRAIVERRGMGLELCLSCNVHAQMITGGFEAHHFGEWWKVDGCVPVLCVSSGPSGVVSWNERSWLRVRRLTMVHEKQTDDVGVFGSPLSNEYRLVAQHFGLTKDDCCKLARKAIDVIFGGEEEKERLRKIMW